MNEVNEVSRDIVNAYSTIGETKYKQKYTESYANKPTGAALCSNLITKIRDEYHAKDIKLLRSFFDHR